MQMVSAVDILTDPVLAAPFVSGPETISYPLY